MIHLLAQTTQGSGFSSWDVAQWTAFFGALTLMLGALTTSILAILNAAKAGKSADINTARISDVSQKVDRQSTETTEKIKLAMSSPPVVVVPTNGGQPPTPTPEQIAQALKEQKP